LTIQNKYVTKHTFNQFQTGIKVSKKKDFKFKEEIHNIKQNNSEFNITIIEDAKKYDRAGEETHESYLKRAIKKLKELSKTLQSGGTIPDFVIFNRLLTNPMKGVDLLEKSFNKKLEKFNGQLNDLNNKIEILKPNYSYVALYNATKFPSLAAEDKYNYSRVLDGLITKIDEDKKLERQKKEKDADSSEAPSIKKSPRAEEATEEIINKPSNPFKSIFGKRHSSHKNKEKEDEAPSIKKSPRAEEAMGDIINIPVKSLNKIEGLKELTDRYAALVKAKGDQQSQTKLFNEIMGKMISSDKIYHPLISAEYKFTKERSVQFFDLQYINQETRSSLAKATETQAKEASFSLMYNSDSEINKIHYGPKFEGVILLSPQWRGKEHIGGLYLNHSLDEESPCKLLIHRGQGREDKDIVIKQSAELPEPIAKSSTTIQPSSSGVGEKRLSAERH
jgi:hypothetical protein